MKWASERGTFRRGDGTLASINLTPDAWLITESCPETLKRAVNKTIVDIPKGYQKQNWQDMLWAFPREGTTRHVQDWIDRCCIHLSQFESPLPWVSLLSNLRLEGALLWPSMQSYLPFPGYPHFRKNSQVQNKSALTELEHKLLDASTNDMRTARSLVLAVSPLRCPEDIDETGCLAVLDRSAAWWTETLESDVDLSYYRDRLTKQLGQASFQL